MIVAVRFGASYFLVNIRILEVDVDLPKDVIQYIQYFKKMIDEQSVLDIQDLYEHGWPEITERYFSEKMWPSENVVEQIVGPDNRLFIILYKELYYRDLYTRNLYVGFVK